MKTKFNLSRTVSHGCVVSLRKNKIIRCGKYARPIGIWFFERKIIMRDLNWKQIGMVIPGGVQTWGECEVKIENKIR